jgi:hypothetical protein
MAIQFHERALKVMFLGSMEKVNEKMNESYFNFTFPNQLS